MPADPLAVARYAHRTDLSPEVKALLSTPAVHKAVLFRLQEGFNEREACVMAVSGALAAAMAVQPALLGDLDENQLVRVLEEARGAQASTSLLEGGGGRLAEAIGFAASQLEGVFANTEADDVET